MLMIVLLGTSATACDFKLPTDADLPNAPVLIGECRGEDTKIADYSIERVLDDASWQTLWARHAPGEKAPAVDFSTAVVIAIFTGPLRKSMTPDVRLAGVVAHDSVDIITKYFVNDVIGDETHSLYLFVALRRTTKPIRVIAHSYCFMCQPQERQQVLREFSASPAAK